MQEAGWKDAPVKIVDWSEEKQREFIIKDNVSGGEWDWELLANEWDTQELNDWGLTMYWDTPDDAPPTKDGPAHDTIEYLENGIKGIRLIYSEEIFPQVEAWFDRKMKELGAGSYSEVITILCEE
jgi:hypothetical protein